METCRVIGIDFDNTLVNYDVLFHRIALERGLISAGPAQSKREIRDAIRRLPEGDILWQKLQAVAYGPRIGEAIPSEGFADFLRACRHAAATVYVVSHKTERAGFDESGINLRQAALQWMADNSLLGGAGLDRDAVHFSPTRAEKIDLIRRLGCTHFIDDLVETFLEPGFPGGVVKILYAPLPSDVPAEVKVARSWNAD